MQAIAVLYLACLLAGFALINIPSSAILTSPILSFFDIVGGLAIIIFALALLFHGVKALVKK